MGTEASRSMGVGCRTEVVQRRLETEVMCSKGSPTNEVHSQSSEHQLSGHKMKYTIRGANKLR